MEGKWNWKSSKLRKCIPLVKKIKCIKVIIIESGEKEDNEVRKFMILSQEICYINSQIGRES